VNVTDNKALGRYELRDGQDAGGDVVGFTEYHFHGDEMAFLHTEIEPEFGGRGYASHLIRDALDDARTRGLKVLPYCPFVREWMGRHADYQDLVPATHRSMFDT
jgi:predicted GNAT family acetyltransferase